MGVGVGVGESVGMGVDGAGVKVARGVTVDKTTGSVGGGDVGVGSVISGPQPTSKAAASSSVSRAFHDLNITDQLSSKTRIASNDLLALRPARRLKCLWVEKTRTKTYPGRNYRC